MTDVEQVARQERLPKALEAPHGEVIEAKLDELARIGGDGRAVSRLALSKEDFESRKWLTNQMEEAGMQVEEHPLGLVGRYEGANPDLADVAVMSHFDSVPNGGKYDGTVGVVAGIEFVRSLNDQGVKLARGITVIALTGEESSRFNVALFGSYGMFQGLTGKLLASRKPGDKSIAEALKAAGFNLDEVREPFFKSDEFCALIELHVSQDSQLDHNGYDLAVIEAIAAPDRFLIKIGEPLQPDTSESKQVLYLEVEVKGRAGHSGATPMGEEFRADALVAAADVLITAKYLQNRLNKAESEVKISVGGVSIEGEALNKIPGNTKMTVRISGETEDVIREARQELKNYVTKRNEAYHEPISMDMIEVEAKEVEGVAFFNPEEISLRHELAGRAIKLVDLEATKSTSDKVVGTVGTYMLNGKGQIIMGVDIRGIEVNSRNEVVAEIKRKIEREAKRLEVSYEVERLAGSSDPVTMDERLVALAEEVIEKNSIGSHERTFSPAGHDAQNAARAGIPTVMIFIPSRNGGVSHNPEEYSSPRDLRNGTQVLAALAYELASEEGEK